MIAESFSSDKKQITRTVVAGGLAGKSSINIGESKHDVDELAHLWWSLFLRGFAADVVRERQLTCLDVFCGSGGLSLGAAQAAAAVGLSLAPLAAADIDSDALDVYNKNFTPKRLLPVNIASCVDFHVYDRGADAKLAYKPEIIERELIGLIGGVDLVLAGPPCQGHSNLNNHTRGSDPRNMLYLPAVAAVIALDARMAVIENVADILRDPSSVTLTAETILRQSGYDVSSAIVNASELCCAQTRKRHFLVATKTPHTHIGEVIKRLSRPPMSLRQAIGDLRALRGGSFMDDAATLSVENQARINFLFDKKLYDLPNKERPDCHKNGHTYPAVYGRLYWDKPAPTITTGFMTPGRGRYIHPSRRRVLTPREAARIQGFPDSFSFMANGTAPSKKLLAKWIGDAVPSQLGYAAVLAALSSY